MGADRPAGEVTRLLVDVGNNDARAREQLLPLVYEELRRIAAGYMRGERGGHTLQPTALVHEAYLRLVDQRRVDWRNRAQFLGLAATMMRRVLLNHARDRAAAKRGGNAKRITVTLSVEPAAETELDVLALHEALRELAAQDARKAHVVELKFFGGLRSEEISALLDVSVATVERDWSFARAWLLDALQPATSSGVG